MVGVGLIRWMVVTGVVTTTDDAVFTVTVVAPDTVEAFPAASVAIAVIEWLPSARVILALQCPVASTTPRRYHRRTVQHRDVGIGLGGAADRRGSDTEQPDFHAVQDRCQAIGAVVSMVIDCAALRTETHKWIAPDLAP